MTAPEPLSADARSSKLRQVQRAFPSSWETTVIARYEATVQAVEAERDDARDSVRMLYEERDALREALEEIVSDAPRGEWARDPVLIARDALGRA